MKLFSIPGMAVLTLSLMPQLAWAAAPKGIEKQARQPMENNCVVIEDGNALTCAGGDADVANKARGWIEDRAASLRAKPSLSAEEQTLLQDYEARLSDPQKIITIKKLPH